MDPNQSNVPDGSNGASFPGDNSSQYPGPWNPYMYGYQCPPSWFLQGFQHLPPNGPMMHQQVFEPADMVEPSRKNDEAEREEVPAPVVQGPTGKGRTKKVVSRTKLGNFNPDEDVNIVKSWLEISCDPIISTGQKRERMWDRIVQRYNLRRGSNPERSLRSLQSRWETIKTEVAKFASFHADAIREDRSGQNDQDKTTQAGGTFASVMQQTFGFMHCWEIMKDEPKWQDLKTNACGKSTAGHEFGEDSTQDLQNNNQRDANSSPTRSAGGRPMGRDSAKAAKKKANSDAGSTSSSEYASRMQELSLQKISMLQEESLRKSEHFQQLASIDEKRYEEMRSHNQSLLHIEQEKVQIMREKHEKEMQEKEKLDDKRILAIDLNACTPAQRLYYQALQEDIFEKLAARRGKRHDP